MDKYSIVYRCQICNTLFRYGQPHEVPQEQLTDVIIKVIKNQMFLGSPLYQAPMDVPHQCQNGHMGVAHFAGLYKEPSQQPAIVK